MQEQRALEATERAQQAGKCERVVEKIVVDVLNKYWEQHTLMQQAYIWEEEMTVAQLVHQAIGQIGENIVV